MELPKICFAIICNNSRFDKAHTRASCQVMPKRASSCAASGATKARAAATAKKAKNGGGMPSLPPAALQLPHSRVFDTWV